MADLDDFKYTDGLNDVLAVYVNRLQAATLRGEYRNVETLSATRALVDNDCPIQVLTPDGADQDVTFPTPGPNNHPFFIVNDSDTYSLILPSPHDPIGPGSNAFVVGDGVAWHVVSGAGGGTVDPADLISTDADNALVQGADEKLFVPESVGGSGDGWIPATGAWTYVSADSPSFVVNVPDADAAMFSVGARFSLTQTTEKFFIVTAKGAPSGGNTPCTIYGGTDYTLANATITNPKWSIAKAPLNFPLQPAKWTTVLISDTADRSQATPTQNVWYNLGSLSGAIPIGCWRIKISMFVQSQSNVSQTSAAIFATLSTANNSESDSEMSGGYISSGASGTIVVSGTLNIEKVLTLAAKTTYYLNARTTLATAASINFRGDRGATVLRAECAYL